MDLIAYIILGLIFVVAVGIEMKLGRIIELMEEKNDSTK